jgi:hypothetical protein
VSLSTKVVPLVTLPNEIEARLLAQRLDEEGIPSVIKPLGGGYGVLGVTQFISHRVYVPQEHLSRAKEIAEARPPCDPIA